MLVSIAIFVIWRVGEFSFFFFARERWSHKRAVIHQTGRFIVRNVPYLASKNIVLAFRDLAPKQFDVTAILMRVTTQTIAAHQP